MEHYVFFYHDSLMTGMPHVASRHRLAMEMQSFPTGTSDTAVLSCARKDECSDHGVAATSSGSDGLFSRKLIRVVEVARELSRSSAK